MEILTSKHEYCNRTWGYLQATNGNIWIYCNQLDKEAVDPQLWNFHNNTWNLQSIHHTLVTKSHILETTSQLWLGCHGTSKHPLDFSYMADWKVSSSMGTSVFERVIVHSGKRHHEFSPKQGLKWLEVRLNRHNARFFRKHVVCLNHHPWQN